MGPADGQIAGAAPPRLGQLLALPDEERARPTMHARITSLVRGLKAMEQLAIDDDALEKVLALSTCTSYAAGATIVTSSAFPDGVYFVVDGAVELNEPHITTGLFVPPGETLAGGISAPPPRLLRTGGVFGLLQLHEHNAFNEYIATAQADGCCLLEVPRAAALAHLVPAYKRQLHEKLSLLRSGKLFGSWEREPLCRLAESMESRYLGEDELLFRQGAPADFCFMVSSGSIDICVHAHKRPAPALFAHADEPRRRACERWELVRQATTRSGIDVRAPLRQVSTVHRGALVGEAALLTDGLVRNATVISMGAHVHLLTKATLLSSLDERMLASAREEAAFAAATAKARAARTPADVDILLARLGSLPLFAGLDERAARELVAGIAYARVSAGTRIRAPPWARAAALQAKKVAIAPTDVLVVLSGQCAVTVHVPVGASTQRLRSEAAETAELSEHASTVTMAVAAMGGKGAGAAVEADEAKEPSTTRLGGQWESFDRTAGPGDSIGEMAAALGDAPDASVKASTAVEVIGISRAAFRAHALDKACLERWRDTAQALLKLDLLYTPPPRAAAPAAVGAAERPGVRPQRSSVSSAGGLPDAPSLEASPERRRRAPAGSHRASMSLSELAPPPPRMSMSLAEPAAAASARAAVAAMGESAVGSPPDGGADPLALLDPSPARRRRMMSMRKSVSSGMHAHELEAFDEPSPASRRRTPMHRSTMSLGVPGGGGEFEGVEEASPARQRRHAPHRSSMAAAEALTQAAVASADLADTLAREEAVAEHLAVEARHRTEQAAEREMLRIAPLFSRARLSRGEAVLVAAPAPAEGSATAGAAGAKAAAAPSGGSSANTAATGGGGGGCEGSGCTARIIVHGECQLIVDGGEAVRAAHRRALAEAQRAQSMARIYSASTSAQKREGAAAASLHVPKGLSSEPPSAPRDLPVAVLGVGNVLCSLTLRTLCPALAWRLASHSSGGVEALEIAEADLLKLLRARGEKELHERASRMQEWVSARVHKIAGAIVEAGVSAKPAAVAAAALAAAAASLPPPVHSSRAQAQAERRPSRAPPPLPPDASLDPALRAKAGSLFSPSPSPSPSASPANLRRPARSSASVSPLLPLASLGGADGLEEEPSFLTPRRSPRARPHRASDGGALLTRQPRSSHEGAPQLAPLGPLGGFDGASPLLFEEEEESEDEADPLLLGGAGPAAAGPAARSLPRVTSLPSASAFRGAQRELTAAERAQLQSITSRPSVSFLSRAQAAAAVPPPLPRRLAEPMAARDAAARPLSAAPPSLGGASPALPGAPSAPREAGTRPKTAAALHSRTSLAPPAPAPAAAPAAPSAALRAPSIGVPRSQPLPARSRSRPDMAGPAGARPTTPSMLARSRASRGTLALPTAAGAVPGPRPRTAIPHRASSVTFADRGPAQPAQNNADAQPLPLELRAESLPINTPAHRPGTAAGATGARRSIVSGAAAKAPHANSRSMQDLAIGTPFAVASES